MDTPNYSALVVDDDPVLRSHLSRALAKEEFSCSQATDGVEANQRLRDNTYDVVVTDLQMPNRHGHALACDILTAQRRPLLVVLTGLIEPRLAKDILMRGVDDIVFKPVDYQTFAAKVKALVLRRRLACPEPVDEAADHDELEAGRDNERPPANVSDIAARLPKMALDLYQTANSDGIDAKQLATAISNNKPLADEVVRLANSKFYNRAGVKISGLQQAVIQVGQRRIGQLALTANAIAALVPENTVQLDVSSFWRRSVATGFAVELLVAQGQHHQIREGLLLCATMHSVGRLFLSALYPQQYEAATRQCRESNEALPAQVSRMFPRSQAEVTLDVLAKANVSPQLTEPLRDAGNSFKSIATLGEPLRSQTEIVKLAVFLAQIVLKSWDAWDLVEIPPPELLSRLGLHSIAAIMGQIEANVGGINDFQTQRASVANSRPPRGSKWAYRALSTKSYDFLAEVLRSLGVAMLPPTNDGIRDEPLILNCLDASSDEALVWLESHATNDVRVVCETAHYCRLSQHHKSLAIPNSVAALRAALA